jgi:nitrite reductase/ring-hydroxylating ferredoxin subunit
MTRPRLHPVQAVPADGVEARAASPALDYRAIVPATGLRNYWYPAARVGQVGRRAPFVTDVLGERIVLFRGRDDAIAALGNDCPHRGEALSAGRCRFAGTITCAYHGWTFDASGDCVAVLGEGPRSLIPGQRSSRAKRYPTETLKGIVFVWIGDDAPVPISEDVPPEFLDPGALVLTDVKVWACNWRPALENYLDAHVFYVHRNSLRIMGMPWEQLAGIVTAGPRRPRPVDVNGRALALPSEMADEMTAARRRTDIREVYEQLDGAIWPRTQIRYRLSRFISIFRRNIDRRMFVTDREWSFMHLPGVLRAPNPGYMYTRTVVPISEDASRIFYFHTRRPSAPVHRVYYRAAHAIFYRWYYNRNFSGQDAKVLENQSYTTSEKLSGSDVVTIEWRKLVLRNARRASWK